MSEKKKDLEPAEAVALAATLNTVLLMSFPHADAGAQATMTVGGTVMSRLIGPSVRETFDSLVTEVCLSVGVERFVEEAKTERGKKVIAMLFGSAMESPDAAANPVIIALGNEYLQHGSVVDRFMRGCMRMLVLCDAIDIGMLTKTFGVIGSGEHAFVKVVRHASDRERPYVYFDDAGGAFVPKTTGLPVTNAEPDRIFQLLSGNGLARMATYEGSFPAQRTPTRRQSDGVTMSGDYARRLARIFTAAQA